MLADPARSALSNESDVHAYTGSPTAVETPLIASLLIVIIGVEQEAHNKATYTAGFQVSLSTASLKTFPVSAAGLAVKVMLSRTAQ